ncbi:MAG: hypoxanthine phosphoribosyltransferase [Actinobacteria bacterium ATB1]|nr:hypoxanthine phosphoribosyltransferase [Actinobacteria bacterium ATB1]
MQSLETTDDSPNGPAPGRVVLTERDIRRRVSELGSEITRDYAHDPPLLVGVLKGAFVLMADIAREIRLPVTFDFMAVSSYGGQTHSSGVVRILKDLDIELEGRSVLVVEDVVDSGLTLHYLLRNLKMRKPKSLEVCAFLVKESRQRVELPIRYTGFEIPPDFVVGYGLDFDGRYRNLPHLAVLDGV